jgi:hypothetical protein
MTKAGDIEGLFDLWEQNVATVRALDASREKLSLTPGFAQSLVAHLKGCAVALVRPSGQVAGASAQAFTADSVNSNRRSNEPGKIDKSTLTIGEVKRIRSHSTPLRHSSL